MRVRADRRTWTHKLQMDRIGRDEWIPVPVPAIIDRPTYDLAQKRKQDLRRLPGGHSKNHCLMRSRLTCSTCGYGMPGQLVRHKCQYYLCSGRRQIVSMCDMPAIHGDREDVLAWDWVRTMIEHPENLWDGFESVRAELEQENVTVQDRLSAIDNQLNEKQGQLNKLIDLYLADEFPKDLLVERTARLERELCALRVERSDLAGHVRTVVDADA